MAKTKLLQDRLQPRDSWVLSIVATLEASIEDEWETPLLVPLRMVT